MNVWEKLPANFTALAPMEGVTDVMFRQVVAAAGRPDLFFTEFTNVSSYASAKGRANALERLEVATTDAPIIAQIWGKNPEHFRALAADLERLGFAGIDINMGCPDRHVNRAGGGAAMILTPDLALDCLRQAKAATRLPVSVKTRLGYTRPEEFREWLPVLLEGKPAALTVHLRTRKEMSKVLAHYEFIPEIVSLVRRVSPETKLVINGDIKDLRQIRQMAALGDGVDGWMIGRGVFENPFCFTDHRGTREELLELLRLHLRLFDEYSARHAERFGRALPFEPLKHYYKIYVNNYPGAAELRARMMECRTTDEVRAVLPES